MGVISTLIPKCIYWHYSSFWSSIISIYATQEACRKIDLIDRIIYIIGSLFAPVYATWIELFD